MTLDFSVWVERDRCDHGTIFQGGWGNMDTFEMEFLATINVVPSQITPNVWA